MSKPVSTIRNLGPASEAEYAKAGIHDAETLRSFGADAAYAMLLQSGCRPHFIGYYALVMGLQGRPWNDCQGDEKVKLRAQFDLIKSGNSQPMSKIEAILNEIGVVEK
ncbi:MAG: TfoX/Sxy family protein [Paracoccaceae bacterium]|jgi:DNA transformation protein and related proteins|nr:TfoX/Sxy family protein [Paracoccaceae bacterium]